MKLTELFLGELDREAEISRRVLERVPQGKNDWKPHEKSMPMGYLATLVATMPGWIAMMINQDELDLAKAKDSGFHPQLQETSSGLVQVLEKSVAQARAALANTTDEYLLTRWRLLVAGHVVNDLPRHQMIRDAVFSHMAHHRGQLTVYLRLNEAKVPAIYGPSADEGKM
jgi:uncharacterized damage-inducible protein DinB